MGVASHDDQIYFPFFSFIENYLADSAVIRWHFHHLVLDLVPVQVFPHVTRRWALLGTRRHGKDNDILHNLKKRRSNGYSANLEISEVDGVWKLTGLERLDEQRL